MNSTDSPVPNAEPASEPEQTLDGPDKPTFSESGLVTGAPVSEGEPGVTTAVKVGMTLGGYRLVKKLGEGGMGFVFEAEEARLKRRVAMKVMKPDVAARENNRERFIREAQAAALVEHDHIVPILTVGEENNVPFIVMPFLKGEPLDARLKRSRLDVPEIVAIGRQSAEGLEAAHKHGLIHRDIKPANIWLEKTDSAGIRVKILDFGLARNSGEEKQLTQSGAIMGTPAYMAPEQARGLEVDHRADLFSLGCILYEMCTGKRAFAGRDTMSILTSLALDAPVEPIKLNPQLPPALSRITMQLLEKAPGKRMASARDVAEALKKLQPESTVVVIAHSSQAVEASPWQDIDSRESEMTHRVSVQEPGSRSADREGMQAPSFVQRAAAKPGRSKLGLLIGAGLLGIVALAAIVVVMTRSKDTRPEVTDGGSAESTGAANFHDTSKKDSPQKNAPTVKALALGGKGSHVDVTSIPIDLKGVTLEGTFESAKTRRQEYSYFNVNGGFSLSYALDADGTLRLFAIADFPNNRVLINPGVAIESLDGKRTRVAFTWSDTKMQIFIDGKKIGEQTLPNRFDARVHFVQIAAGFDGLVHEVRISNTVRYSQDYKPESHLSLDKDTLALYRCDEGQGNVLKDSSGNRHQGVVTGGKWVKVDAPTVPLAKAPPEE